MDDAPPLSLYVHWPWCKAKCPYCDFNSHVWAGAGERPVAAYGEALSSELNFWKEQLGKRTLTSVFVGGGTPSLMGAGEIGKLLERVDATWGLPADAEVTVECNPTSSSRDLFANLRQVGVNRVSVGVQGLTPTLLTFLGREHGVAEAAQTLEDALCEIRNVNADLIYGLPDQSLHGWEAQLRTMTQLGLPHLSCYQLTIEKNTAFWGDVQRGAWAPLDMDTQADFCEVTNAVLAEAGYGHYEVSNFAQKGAVCRHNVNVWRYGDYVGIGAGAHGRVTMGGATWRTAVRRDPADYMKKVPENQQFSVYEALPMTAAAQEAILMGLRLVEGLDLGMLQKKGYLQWLLEGEVHKTLSYFERVGWMQRTKTHLRCTEAGWLRLDGMLRQLFHN